MAGICTAHNRKGGAGCDHRAVTVSDDGEAISFECMQAELAVPMTAEQRRQRILLNLQYLVSVKGLSLDQAVGRVICGEEATNIKQYHLLTRDVTKTNIGTNYVNVAPGANGERSIVDFTGCTEFRVILNMNFVGTGPMNIRIVRDSDDAVLYESPNITTPTGEKELNSGWQAVPAAAVGEQIVRFQAKSTTGADDPVFRRCQIHCK